MDKDLMKIGDEVAFHWNDGRPDTVVVITHIGQDGFIDGMDAKGTLYASKNPQRWTKTGRHFPLVKLLLMQMDGQVTNDDTISRQAAIDAIMNDSLILLNMDSVKDGDIHRTKRAISRLLASLPSAQPDLDEWCTDCKEYDQERHCCPRWNRVIRNTLKEVKSEQRWIPVESEPPKERRSYWVCTDTGYQCQCRWTNDIYGIFESDKWGWKIFDIPQYTKVVAYMPLPKPYERSEE